VRYRVPHTQQSLRSKLEAILAPGRPEVTTAWFEGAEVYDSPDGDFREIVTQAVRSITGITPAATRDGGTSDGRFIAATGAHVVECGPSNATIHQVDECLPIEQLSTLTEVYREILDGVRRGW
jgi:succinyl-diaminopimelate desuccinylase